MKFRLTVKGSQAEAEQACQKHGMNLADVTELSLGTTVGTVDSSHTDLAKWFSEPVKCTDGIGFPVGTLLFYNEVSEGA